VINRLDGTARTFKNVQGLRAIAALLVFSVHLNVIEQRFAGSSQFLRFLNPLGEWGVDLFFVISGFVMITSTWNEFATPAISLRFFLRRLTRVYPPYWIMMIPIVALYIVAPTMVNGSQAIRPSIPASLLLLPQLGKPLLTVSWTLVYEMFFYVVFSLVLAFDRRWCLPLMTAWGLLTLLIATVTFGQHNVYLETYSSPLLLEFILGVFAGWVIRTRKAPLPIASLIAGLIGIACADVYYDAFNAAAGLNGSLRFLCVGVPVLLIFNGIVGLETNAGYVLPRVLQKIGNSSYSLYLWHVPLSIFIGRLSLNLLRVHTNPWLHALWLTAVIFLVVGASMLLYQWIERPLLKLFGRWMRDVDTHLPVPQVPGLAQPLTVDTIVPR
jgi:exopolysaccharide production protein ExoZ